MNASKKLLRANGGNIVIDLELETEVVHLLGFTLSLAHSLSRLIRKATRRLPQDQCQQVIAGVSALIAGLQQDLEAEKAALAGPKVAVEAYSAYSYGFKRQIFLNDPFAVAVVLILADLDKLAQQWLALSMPGKLGIEVSFYKTLEWRERFQSASAEVKSLGIQWNLRREPKPQINRR